MPLSAYRNRHSRTEMVMSSNDSLHRSVLPIPDRSPTAPPTYDAKDPDTKFPPIKPLRPPAGAPNVLVILLDDVRNTRQPDSEAPGWQVRP